jgi:pimeloyl-ACP methyl ester carboxylesterase
MIVTCQAPRNQRKANALAHNVCMKANTNGVEIEYEFFGNTEDAQGHAKPCVVLIMGLGMQMIAWPIPLIDALVAKGYRVLRFDNRDIGLSTHSDTVGVPNLPWNGLKVALGLKVKSFYTLTDMARDSIGLFDALNLKKVHVVGASMGGMIAQIVAYTAPEKVASLTSIMSTSGRLSLPGPTMAARGALLSRPANPSDLESVADHSVKMFRVIGSPNNPETDAIIRERVMRGLKRAYHPAGTARQLMAVAADGSRVTRLAQIKAPTLVMHGENDPLVPIAGGRDTAASIPGAKFVSIPGMGHDFAPSALATMTKELTEFLSGLN